MAVTLYPASTTFVFGSTNETGIAVETYAQNDQVDEFQQKNQVGEVIELVTYNPRGEQTVTGEITSALTQVLGKTIVFTNWIPTQFGTPPATGISVVRGVNNSKGRAKNMAATITAGYWPLVTAT
jgi:hypothetical protein